MRALEGWREMVNHHDAAAAYNVLENSSARTPGCKKAIKISAKMLLAIDGKYCANENIEVAVWGS